MLDLLPALGGLTVLDAGCGTGRYARLLKERGAGHIVGVDLSAAMLARASHAADRVRGDIRALPLAADTFDVIVSGLMLPDIADLGRVASEWQRVLKPGGVVVCSTLHPVGAELGWTRTFETPHGTHTLPAHWHTLSDHQDACAAAGLIIDLLAEPCLDQHPPPNPRTGEAMNPPYPHDPRTPGKANPPNRNLRNLRNLRIPIPIPVALVMRARRLR